MEDNEQSLSTDKGPQVRFLIACPRSGSTLLMRIFAESSECAVTSGLMGNPGSDGQFRPDYSILAQAQQLHKCFLVSKEKLGNQANKGEGLLLAHSAYSATRPVFLIRDPVRVFDSWKNIGWTDIQSLIDYYKNIFRLLSEASANAASFILYEKLAQDPYAEIKQICGRWEVPFSESMLKFEKPFGSSFIFGNDRERTICCQERARGIFSTLESSTAVISNVPMHGLLSNSEKDSLEEHIGRSYIRYWQPEASRMREILLEKKWIGFDLDDTLHEFRRASSRATKKVLAEISDQYGTSLSALEDEYSKILRLKTANAFSDGKISFDYRKDRFSLLLERFSLPPTQHLTHLLDTYEATLTANLELKCGAKGLLSTIKNMGQKIVVITEGPQDAQERTIDALGIRGYVDFLATTNHFRVSKTDGLFSKVMDHLGISPGDIAYIGDNEERDMAPSMAHGIFAMHLAESRNVSLSSFPPRVNTLRKVQYIFGG